MGDSHLEESSVSSRGHDFSPPKGDVEIVGLALEGDQLLSAGFSTDVFEIILNSRAPSLRKLYALKWGCREN